MKISLLQLRLWRLKSRARRLHRAITRESDLGCGIGLLEYIRPRLITKNQELACLVRQAKALEVQIEELED
jgi:hypothetical protein